MTLEIALGHVVAVLDIGRESVTVQLQLIKAGIAMGLHMNKSPAMRIHAQVVQSAAKKMLLDYIVSCFINNNICLLQS